MEMYHRLASMMKQNDSKIIVVGITYLLAANLGFVFGFSEYSALPIWPANGVAFALVILMGYRVWPGIFIGSILTYVLAFIRLGWAINVNEIASIAIISTGNVAEILLGFVLYRYLIKDGTPYDKTSNTFKFLFLSMTLGLVSASVETLTLSLYGIILEQGARMHFITSYLADITGYLVFTNLILAWVKGKHFWKWNLKNISELVVFSAAIFTLLYFINTDSLSVAVERAFPFLILPFLLWVAFRSSVQLGTIFVLGVSLFSIYITSNGSGPFILDQIQNSIFLLQIFMIVIATTTLILSSAVFERMEAKKKVEDFNESLEKAVLTRTQELKDEIKNRKATESKIRDSNKELRKINGELDSFVYKVSHDLRAPISSILGLVNIAKIDKSKKNMLECIDQIEKSANTQDNFIRDIIDLTKNSRLTPKKEKIDFGKIIHESFDHLKYAVEDRRIIPEIDIKQEKDFFSDENRLKIIFNNLLSNSIKYGPANDARIDVQVLVENGHADIAVSDNGRGIEEKHLDDVFKMFYRATDQNAGSGLGLYIVKETVDRLKGEVKLESELNKGTRVQMNIPNLAEDS